MQTMLKKEGALLMPIARLRTEREAIMNYDDAKKVWANYYKMYPSKKVKRDEAGAGAYDYFDHCDALIAEAAYGDRNSKMGWEVDHIKPDSKQGSDAYSNLRPLHWKNNEAKRNREEGQWRCVVTTKKDKNGNLYNYNLLTHGRFEP